MLDFARTRSLKRIDAGLGQINLGWNGQRFPSLCASFDPVDNLTVTALLLRQHYNASPEAGWTLPPTTTIRRRQTRRRLPPENQPTNPAALRIRYVAMKHLIPAMLLFTVAAIAGPAVPMQALDEARLLPVVTRNLHPVSNPVWRSTCRE